MDEEMKKIEENERVKKRKWRNCVRKKHGGNDSGEEKKMKIKKEENQKKRKQKKEYEKQRQKSIKLRRKNKND